MTCAVAFSAQADNNSTPPDTEVRLLVGLGLGAEVSKAVFDHRLRLDLGAHGIPTSGWVDAAVSGRVLGSASNGLWVRGGFLGQRIDQHCGPAADVAIAFDAGLAYRHRWAGGSLVAAEGGVERVTRGADLVCSDSVLKADSLGARVSLAGQIPLTPSLALHGRLGVRTGEHIKEIGLLPELWLGLAYSM